VNTSFNLFKKHSQTTSNYCVCHNNLPKTKGRIPKHPQNFFQKVPNIHENLISFPISKNFRSTQNLTKRSLVSYGEKTNKKPSFPVKFVYCTRPVHNKHEIPPVLKANKLKLFVFPPTTPNTYDWLTPKKLLQQISLNTFLCFPAYAMLCTTIQYAPPKSLLSLYTTNNSQRNFQYHGKNVHKM
jgi:hypothetical protein